METTSTAPVSSGATFPFMDQIRLPVRVQADWLAVLRLQRAPDLDERLQPDGRLAVAAENELVVPRAVLRRDGGEHLRSRRLMRKPEGVGAVHAVAVVADAEIAAVGAAVGQVDIQPAADRISIRIPFFHLKIFGNSRRAFSVVILSMYSGVCPRCSASAAIVRRISALSLRLPRCGCGAR